ncbi:mannose-1-phosphate guanylyltransferase/mannose-6-phosphate isomerase [Paenibacillus sp. KQZ6P-2]|uniref:mannose-1-phosphate guanylyltransferase n=1 Tax=Paenibacillus mangrovi TaxID=2931978 RepID=A0A9X1WPH4_9BACL|nr:mannose-1-phosphate guanylyltransferase/mannose-6-phosphate isomerase [Paenibacillus mangrovi]MCJ8012684.1 mannose-1-phosphate guanylyltransferase/mannose-6-phosphate isomerase [Paenibacillus mangrovi]
MINVVLCGGNGTRLWPLSRTRYPKQFNKFISDRSLFQMTVERNRSLCDSIFVVSNEEQYFLALDHLEEIRAKADQFLLEPVGRNTAPAIALASLAADMDELVLVTPSDHIIKNEMEYSRVINLAKSMAEEGNIVTFGITPSHAETGYGYIESDGYKVISFREKPDLYTAEQYINSGHYYWNSGMFLFKAGVFLNELETYSPEIYQRSVVAFEHSKKNNDIIRIQKDDMESIPSDSIDYAVMEKSENVKVIPSNIGWSDLGSFEALYEELPKDECGNTEAKHFIGIDSTSNMIISDNRMITTIDVNDLMIVDTPDALLVSRKGSSQKVKDIVDELKQSKSSLCDNHTTTYRPWGNHTVLDQLENYKIKTVVVKPGGKISMQRHFHRSEHWIVVSGTAKIVVNGNESLLRVNESTFIRMGDEHSVENPGKIDLHMIEVHVGEYIGEDDTITI